MVSTRYALITGCSAGGIGHALALAFLRHNVHVFATARSRAKMADLADLPNVIPLELDVTSPESVAAAVQAVRTRTGGRLDYLINNAGVGYRRPALDLDLERARALFDVNFWGYVAMAQAFAPLLVAARGCVVNVGSIAGLHYLPYLSVYTASKAAVHAFSETLRLELAPLGVRVVTAVAGGVHTRIRDNARFDPLPAGSRYGACAADYEASARGRHEPPGSDVHDFARQLVDDVVGGATGKVYPGAMTMVARILAMVVPTWILDIILLKNKGLEKVHP